MSEASPPALPAWVYKRDGRLVPFDADKISRALFAAGESLGRPDPFLARELADGVVHFLADESDGTPSTTAQVAELVVKVVRELGQPALAEAFAQFARQRDRQAAPPALGPSAGVGRPGPAAPAGEVVLRFATTTPLAEVLPACARAYTLQAVFTRDLVAAQADGLITLTGLEAPGELAGCLLGARPQAGGLLAAVEEARRFAGRFLALDGPEYLLAGSGRLGEPDARDFARELAVGLRSTGLEAVVNLNSAAPPSWADDLAEGPLFAGQRRVPGAEHLARLADVLTRELLLGPEVAGRARIDWHLAERDFADSPLGRARLVAAVRWALEGLPLAFVLDRPRRPVVLAEGVDRQRPAVLLTVGLHLPLLARKAEGDPERFLQEKLPSLARLALSAAVQKRAFLRRQERARPERPGDAPAVTSGFLLDRARLVVAPVGLDAVTYTFTGRGLCAGGAALDFGRRLVQRLREVLRQDGRSSHLETCLDGPFRFHLGDTPGQAPGGESGSGPWPAAENAAGLTPWDGTAPVRNQLRAGGVLHAAAEGGTLALFVPPDQVPAPEQVADWLWTAWHETQVVRLRLVRAAPAHRQLTFGG
jgi:hypothetical protein